MRRFFKFFSVILASGLMHSCEIKNQFKEKTSKEIVPSFSDKHLEFTLRLSDFATAEMEVGLGISSIKAEYTIETFDLKLSDNKKAAPFELLNVSIYGAGINSNIHETKSFSDFNSAPQERRVIDSTIAAYYLDYRFIVPNGNSTKTYRVDIDAKISTADSSYTIKKTFLFDRSKYFAKIRWTGC